jgi:hypothetical protein
VCVGTHCRAERGTDAHRINPGYLKTVSPNLRFKVRGFRASASGANRPGAGISPIHLQAAVEILKHRPTAGTVGYRTSPVSQMGDELGPTICGFAACFAGWLRLPGTRPCHPTASSPRRRLSLRRGEGERNRAISARKGGALPQSGAAEPQRAPILDSSDRTSLAWRAEIIHAERTQ